jgi:hypothetical protein
MRKSSLSHSHGWMFSAFTRLSSGTILTIVGIVFLLAGSNRAFGQDCTDCGNRSIYVFDFNINTGTLNIPRSDRDSLRNFLNALLVAPSIAKYLQVADPSASCISISQSGATSTVDTTAVYNSPGLLNLLAGCLPHSPQGEEPDYWIGGTVVGLRTGQLEYHMYLHTASDEIVVSATGTIGFGSRNVYLDVVSAINTQISPIYQKIREFEIRKRDTGKPYAIYPTLIPGLPKFKVKFKEKMKIHFNLNDCDGAPLKQRDVTVVSCDLGTLDKMSFTTDDKGEAELEYTGPDITSGIAVITLTYEYTEPWAKPSDVETREMTFKIDVEPPPNSWGISASYEFKQTKTSEDATSANYTASSTLQSGSIVWVGAWLRKMQLGPNVPSSYFVADPSPVKIKFRGNSKERGQYRSFWSNPLGYIKTVGWNEIVGKSDPASAIKYNISINDNELSFNFTKLAAKQTGQAESHDESYDPLNGFQQSSSTTPADPTSVLNWSTNGFVYDTTYTIQSEVGTNLQIDKFSQKCVWQDTLLRLSVNKDLQSIDDIDMNTGDSWVKSHSKTVQKIIITIKIDYNPGPPSAVERTDEEIPVEFALTQNYPNPFNPSTTFNFSVPKAAFVSLRVFNALGQEVAVLVNEQRGIGHHAVNWQPENIPSGVYLCRLQAGDFVGTRKVVLLK